MSCLDVPADFEDAGVGEELGRDVFQLLVGFLPIAQLQRAFGGPEVLGFGW
jgi:hypothetical protein